MRYNLIILLLIGSVCYGQNWKRGLSVAGWQLASITLGAVGDGLMDSGEKEWGHALHAGEVLMLMSGPFLFQLDKRDYLPYVGGYVFLRFATFDYLYNATRGLPLSHVGTTSHYDKMIQEFNAPPSGWAFAKSISFIVGVSIPIKHF